jgi:hypothetical protein
MANIVYMHVNVLANDAVIRLLNKSFKAIEFGEINSIPKVFFNKKNPTIDWSLKKMGAKWCYVDSYRKGQFTLISAYYPPQEFIKFLFETCISKDVLTVFECKYNEESGEPVGVLLVKLIDSNITLFQDEKHFEVPSNFLDDSEPYLNEIQSYQDESLTKLKNKISAKNKKIDINKFDFSILSKKIEAILNDGNELKQFFKKASSLKTSIKLDFINDSLSVNFRIITNGVPIEPEEINEQITDFIFDEYLTEELESFFPDHYFRNDIEVEIINV